MMRLIILFTLLFSSVSFGQKALDYPSGNSSETEKYRLIWYTDPTTTATIGWSQRSGKPATVCYDEVDRMRHYSKYAFKQTVDRVTDYHGMKNCFARMKNLKPDTEYFFVLVDDAGVSPRFRFRTAPAKRQTFTFIAGGDSRNGRSARQAGNSIVPKLKPLFVAFTGDMINRDEPVCWIEWLDDWQFTTASDGTMTPIIPHRGNHESKPQTIHHLFDTNEDAWFSMSIGGSLMRYYALNSEVPAGGNQGDWLKDDLSSKGKKHTHIVAGYHKPMRPHVSAKSEGKNPYQWANLFYKYGLDLALESDSHVMKRTVPLIPNSKGDEGFSPAKPGDKNATVYIGEGCWGAPLRPADDAKSWTIDCAAFNGFDWIEVSEKAMKVKTVMFSNSVAMGSVSGRNSFENPANTELWNTKKGEILEIPAD